MAEIPEIKKGLIRPHELLDNLIDDVYKGLEFLEEDKDSQFRRRIIIRSVFTFIEGVVHIIKIQLKSDIRQNRTNIELSKKETETLFEEKLLENQKIRLFIPIEKNIVKTFKLAEKVWGVNCFKFNPSKSEYVYLINAKEARNKLTHPRNFYDIQISKTDMNNTLQSFLWIKNEFTTIIKTKFEKTVSEIPEGFIDKDKFRKDLINYTAPNKGS